MLAAALKYAAAGWRVFPCEPGGKAPCRGVRWKEQATTDAETIREWWRNNPRANVAAVTGGELGVVIDIDRLEALDELPAALTTTRTARTGGGGLHYFFETVPGLGNHRGQLPPGIDVRGDGTGYVILPPSVHASGRPYEWRGGVPGNASKMPRPVLRLVQAPRAAAQGAPPTGVQPAGDNEQRARLWLDRRPGAVANWGGNAGWNGDSYLFETAQHVVRGFDLSQAAAVRLLNEWAVKCQTPPSAARIEYKVAEAARVGSMAIGSKLAPRRQPIAANHGPALRPFAPHAPLFETNDRPPFPVDSLPGWAAEFVAAVAESTQTPAELGGLLALIACSAAVMKKRSVKIKSGWVEPLNLWAVVAMPPSSRKSPVYSQIVAPIEKWEAARVVDSNSDRARYMAEREIEERRLASLKADAAKKRGRDKDGIRYEITELAEELANMKPPPVLRMLLSDITPEAFVSFLVSTGGRAALLADEGGIFDNLAGRYSKGRANADAFLKAFSGTGIRVDRRERAEHVAAPALAMGVTVQPQVLAELAGNEALAGRGLLARPLYAVPESNVGQRRSALETPPIPNDLAREYGERLTELLEIRTAEAPRMLTLSDDARALLLAFDQWLESQIAPGEELASLAEWCGKLVGTSARIAGVLAVAERVRADVIEHTHMTRAIALARWAIPHAAAAIGRMGATDEEKGAEKVWKAALRAARRTGETETTARQLAQSLKRTMTADDVYGAVMLLVSHGYMRTDDCKTFEIRPELV